MTSTPVSLLKRLQEAQDPADWIRFAELYSPLILYWAHQFGMQDADAADLAQEVLIRSWKEIGSYHRREGKRFRGWLWTITRNRWLERKRQRPWPTQDVDSTTSVEPSDELQSLVDDEYNRYLVNRALQLMRVEFEPATWKACWQFVVEGQPAQMVAKDLGISRNAVYLAKSRILRRLREELEGLLE